MCKSLDYETYLDKVKGCFLGKTVIGTLGAPYEGVKMPMELKFRDEMVNTMLPNDDLDLQVLWLDVVEKYGPDFTATMLQQAFCDNCDYSPGEYAIMRKNYEKGIYPPTSGRFCNDFYRHGMGCPIRSEIWACLAPGDPEQAADYSTRDGILDHESESVYAERFFAAVEAEAFYEKDMRKLIEAGFTVIPEDCKFREMVEFVCKAVDKYADMKPVLTEILWKYGHTDCTNMLQNMGITLAALLLGEYDMIKTGMLALNCGFDTDCTCASAGALLGIILGQKAIEEQYGWKGIKYVLGVRSHRRSDLVDDLAEDIAKLYTEIKAGKKFEQLSALDISVSYDNFNPSAGIGHDCKVFVTVKNISDKAICVNKPKISLPNNLLLKSGRIGGKVLNPGDSYRSALTFGFAPDSDIIYEKNIVEMTFKAEKEGNKEYFTYKFGISGDRQWKVFGPIWKTTPATDEKVLGEKIGYWHTFTPRDTEAKMMDQVRTFHLNMAVDPDTDFLSEDELFAPLSKGTEGLQSRMFCGGADLVARPIREFSAELSQDAFEVKNLTNFYGSCVVYMASEIISPEDRDVFIQLGASSPVKCFVNGSLICDSKSFCQWDAENNHLGPVHLNKGVNRIVLRLTRGNADAKFSLVFSKGYTCATHYCDMASRRI